MVVAGIEANGAEHEASIVLIGTTWKGRDAAVIEIPDSFPSEGDVAAKGVVITGASRGLGRVLAHAFSRGGARLTLVARTEHDLKAVATELPGPSLVCAGDVTDVEFNEAVADASVAEWGGVDVRICNAGAYQFLASDAAAFVTGAVLNVDGGYLLV
jgi:NAD(P)-dependent dehydrogenase (short-subunit alcohol dehydrogenase family)